MEVFTFGFTIREPITNGQLQAHQFTRNVQSEFPAQYPNTHQILYRLMFLHKDGQIFMYYICQVRATLCRNTCLYSNVFFFGQHNTSSGCGQL